MDSEISVDEFYAFNNIVFSKFSEILEINRFKSISEFDNVISEWDNSYQMNLSNLNVLNPIFSQIVDNKHLNHKSTMQSYNYLIPTWHDIYYLNFPNYFNLLGADFFEKWYKAKIIDDQLNKIDSHNFNILRMFSIGETMHSQLLKLLLNPNGIHGQGNFFLSLFLEEIGVSEPYTGIWKVTAEEGRIDIKLKRNHPLSIIIIENKSNGAEDKKNQLYRYWHKEIYKTTKRVDKIFYEQNKEFFQFVYLVPNGKIYERQTITKPKDKSDRYSDEMPESIPMEIKRLSFYKDVCKWVEKCIERLPNDNHRMHEYLLQYKEICNNL